MKLSGAGSGIVIYPNLKYGQPYVLSLVRHYKVLNMQFLIPQDYKPRNTFNNLPLNYYMSQVVMYQSLYNYLSALSNNSIF